MADIENSVHLTAQMAALGPLAAAALAANMAYLNLARFRYREQMRKCAAEQLVPLGASLPAEVTGMDQYRGLLYLANLKNNDGLDKKRIVPTNIPSRCPPGAWSTTYTFVHAYHEDIFLSTVFCVVATLCILLGTALSIGIWTFTLPYLEGWPVFLFWFLSITALIPGVYIYLGRWVVRKGCEYATDSATQLAGVINRMAIAAPNPAPVAPAVPAPSS